MSNVRDKVQSIFTALVGERASVLEGSTYPADISHRITSAILGGGLDSNLHDPVAPERIGFHLIDWNAEAAFLVALMLYPEQFTDDEIRDGVAAFLIHAPAHCIEAARLGGYPTENPFAGDES